MLIEQLVHDEVDEGDAVASEELSRAEEISEFGQLGLEGDKVFGLQGLEVGVVAETDETVAEVHGLLGQDVHTDALFLSFPHEVVFPGNVAKDGVGLGDFDIAWVFSFF